MASHREKISYIVVPVMLAELVSAIGLVFITSQFRTAFIAGLILLLSIWISTAVIQVPSHSNLANGYIKEEVKKLVKLNWIRTFLWSVRLTVILIVLSHLSFSHL